MIADVRDTGGVHRTFFTEKGKRLKKSAKMMLGPCSGGAVRLSQSTGPLVVWEGIETGLSLLSGLLSGPATVWAALSTSGMRGLHLPPKPDQKSAARTLGFELTLRAQDAWWGLEPVLIADDTKIVNFTRIQDQQTQAHQASAMARRAEHDAP